MIKISFILTLICAYFSIGFLHPDEQYYAIDFAAYKLGILKEITSWEYDTQLRPWSLPLLFMPFLKVFDLLEMNPFSMSLGLRVISALFSFASLSLFINEAKKKLSEKAGDFLFYALHFGFFFKLMMVRTNSENWSTSFFLIAFVFALRRNLVGSSLFSGLSFLIRHQLGLMVLPLGLYFLIVQRVELKKWFLQFCFPMIIVMGLGFLMDSWGYGEMSYSPWNYLYQNIILGKVNTFGEHPFYYYLYKGISKTLPWFLLMIGGWFYYAKNKKLALSFWCVTLFLVVHHLISHKELRFLYPVTPLLIYMGIKALDEKRELSQKIIRFFVITNLFVLPFILFKPAYTPMKFYQFLYKIGVQEIQVTPDDQGRYPALEMEFYKRDELKVIESKASLNEITGLIFTTKLKELKILKERDCSILYSSYPKWLFQYNYFNWLKRSNVWALSKCSP